MAGRALIVCILAVGMPIVHGDNTPQLPDIGPSDVEAPIRVIRRPVAVIDLTNDQVVRDVANKLLEQLAAHSELAPPAISDGAALVDKLAVDDDVRIAEAQKKRLAAEQNLALRNFREAAIDAVEGQEILLHVTPRAAVTLYADLALALGQSRLGEQKDAEAREAFALTHRLDPRRQLDDLHYLPEVVQTFEAAQQERMPIGTLMVRGSGRVWIDGEEVGSAPGEFKVPIGRHVVWLTGLLRETSGREVKVTAARPGDATIMDGQLTRPQKVVRYRQALAQAQDAAARATAMKALAGFVNVHDAVLLSSANGRVVWQTWRDRAPGFSAIRDLGASGVGEILTTLAPPRVVEDPDPPAIAVRIEPERWYQRSSIKVGIAVTIIAVVVGSYLWMSYSEPDRPWDSGIGFSSARGGGAR